MWELVHKGSWMPKNWCFRTVVLEKVLEGPLDSKDSNQSTLKDISPEYSLEGHTEPEAPILWPPGEKSWLIGKDPKPGKDWRQEEIEDKMVGWHHQLNGYEFEQTPRDSEGQGCLACCSPWSCKELDMTYDWTTTATDTTQRADVGKGGVLRFCVNN